MTSPRDPFCWHSPRNHFIEGWTKGVPDILTAAVMREVRRAGTRVKVDQAIVTDPEYDIATKQTRNYNLKTSHFVVVCTNVDEELSEVQNIG